MRPYSFKTITSSFSANALSFICVPNMHVKGGAWKDNIKMGLQEVGFGGLVGLY
jgi:hypothetical protein